MVSSKCLLRLWTIVRRSIISFDKGRNVRVTICATSTMTAALTMETRAHQQHRHQPGAAHVSVCAAARLPVEAASVTLAVLQQEIAVRITR